MSVSLFLRQCNKSRTLLLLDRGLSGALSTTVHNNINPNSINFASRSQQNSTTTVKCNNISCTIDRYYSKYQKPEKRYKKDYDSDSDSDDEHKPRGDTEFWRRKMRTLHRIFDVNNDGVISYDDFRLLSDRFAALGNLSPEADAEFKEIVKKTWEQQFGEVTPYNLVTAEQYLTEMHHMVNDDDLRAKIHSFLPYLFKAVDNDHSGFISLTEFKLFFKCLGLTEEDAAVSFAIIDKNGDGKLSIKEFVKLGRDYFLTEDERRISRMFWGPLIVDH